MKKFLSCKLEGLAQSDIRRMTRECSKIGGINLGQGVCDLTTPFLVRNGAINAIQDNKSIYSFPEGIFELRQAIANKLKEENKIIADPTEEIVVTLGTSGAFTSTVTALLNPGDGIILFEPYYGYHFNVSILAGIEPQFVELIPPNFEINEQEIKAAIKPNTKAIVICTPANPSGKMFSYNELEVIANIANENDLLVITDEIYEYFRYEDKEHISPATLPSLKERTVTLMGLSKTFSITGWRIGYAVAPAEMANAITLVNDVYLICPPTPLQYGVAEGFKLPPEFYVTLRKDFQKKRQLICDALDSVGMTPIIPQGSYYVLADISKLGFDKSIDAAMALLEKTKVASVPGTSFYRGKIGEQLLRFCFAKNDEILTKACERICSFANQVD
ncbi:MAG: pyridoxal phosphate-dependent aminotransferase [Cyanobacteria bacterium J06631_2]